MSTFDCVWEIRIMCFLNMLILNTCAWMLHELFHTIVFSWIWDPLNPGFNYSLEFLIDRLSKTNCTDNWKFDLSTYVKVVTITITRTLSWNIVQKSSCIKIIFKTFNEIYLMPNMKDLWECSWGPHGKRPNRKFLPHRDLTQPSPNKTKLSQGHPWKF